MDKIKTSKQNPLQDDNNIGEDGAKVNSHSLLAGLQIGSAILGLRGENSQNTKNKFTI